MLKACVASMEHSAAYRRATSPWPWQALSTPFSPYFCLQKKQIVHALCTTLMEKNNDGFHIFKPVRLYVYNEEHVTSVTKAFKFEVDQAKKHFTNAISETMEDSPSDRKRKVIENQSKESQCWASPLRRLKLQATADATLAGIK